MPNRDRWLTVFCARPYAESRMTRAMEIHSKNNTSGSLVTQSHRVVSTGRAPVQAFWRVNSFCEAGAPVIPPQQAAKQGLRAANR